MDCGEQGPASTAIGLCLLPSELLEEIFCRLALPEILRLGSVSRVLDSLVSGDSFRQLYGLRSGSGGGWIFVLKKRPPRDAVLRGFNDRAGRWFKFPVAGVLAPAIPPGEDIYFLAASGNLFLFASNGRRELVAVNLVSRSVRRIPPSPLGPRGTSLWRRSGLKLVSDPDTDCFRFLFAELYQNRTFLFEYRSETDAWQATEATTSDQGVTPMEKECRICLNVIDIVSGSEIVVLCTGPKNGGPVIFRPRFGDGCEGGQAIGLFTSSRLHVYGDGNIAVIRSMAVLTDGGRMKVRIITDVTLYGMSVDGREWQLISRAPKELVERVRKPYAVMMGCLEERNEVIRMVLMSSCEDCWNLIWLSYDRMGSHWSFVPVPDCGTKGLNMAGIAFSSSALGLRLSSSK